MNPSLPESGHTPGPWRLDAPQNAHVISDIYHTIDAGCGFLCPGEQPKPGFGISGHMTLADARLITAAPDLLAAGKELLEAFDNTERSAHERACYLQLAVASIRDAIAKATATGRN